MRKTKLQIIEETAAFYMEDPNRRAKKALPGTGAGEYCVYVTEDGRRCAVGRYLLFPERCPQGSIVDILNSDNSGIKQTDFIENARGHEWDFWYDLQQFHDGISYWDKQGITIAGKEYLNRLKQKHAND
jgi:hypothetical protein